ncbi:QsdR family transcriptional regulator [Gordonia sp. CPCC 205515]|uniref:QsdR family transcriptional regulator n=1 Tax=Gordonia sp. CPCC 205515 TaxID=3140791 RepID=UPI003AF4007B
MSEPDHTAVRAVRAARHALIAGEAVDVGKVAAAIGVDRTTVFRRVGNRDILLAEALWSVTTHSSWPAALTAHPPGTEHRAAEVLTTYVRMLIAEPWFRTFLHRDPQRALRILTTADTAIQSRMVDLVQELLAPEPAPPVDLTRDMLAYLAVRVAESFIYSDLIAAKEPDADLARVAFIALLG